MFEIPTTPADESVYDVVKGTSAFISELGYDVNVYDADEFRYSKIIVKNIDNDTNGDALKFRENDGFFVVKKAVRGIANGEVVSVVHGVQGGLDWSYTSTEKDTFDSLKKGDVIRTSYDSRGRLKSYKLIHSFGKEDVYSNLSSGALNGQNTYVFGLVKKVDSVKGRLLVDDGTEKAIRTSSSPKVTLFDTSTGEIKQASLSDIKPDDYICLRLYFSQVRDIVVYSN